MDIRVPVNRLECAKNTVSYVKDAVESTWWSGGSGKYKYHEILKSKFRKYGTHVTLVNSGTAACRAAVFAATRDGSKKHVVTTPYSCAANLAPIYEMRRNALFADIDINTFGVRADELTRCIRFFKDDISAVILTYIYGEPPRDLLSIAKLCEDYGILLISDISQCIGIEKEEVVGDILVASLRAEKMVGGGEGGAVITNDEKLAERVLQFATRGKVSESAAKYWYASYGDNLLMPHVSAAIAVGQWEILDKVVRGKRRAAKAYRESSVLAKVFKFQRHSTGVAWLNFATIHSYLGMSPHDLAAILLEKGIETKPAFVPLTSYWRVLTGVDFVCSEAELAWTCGIVLPSPHDLTDQEIEFIESTVKEVVGI